MRVAIARESRAHERRVAMVPELVSRLTAMDLDVVVESGAGSGSFHTDDAYREAGATVVPSDERSLGDADVVLSVNALPAERMRGLREGAITLSFLSPGEATDVIDAARDARVTAFSIELVPRISRAQSMDGLTSQAMAGGYRAVLVAAERLPRFFPLNMTAAGTVPPAQVLVLGAGVAGLQAIATARRLGAVVEAFDVRPVVKEQVESLGATFVEVEMEEEETESKGGYAKELDERNQIRQREVIHQHAKKSDIVITTALIPGRPAPVLITKEMVKDMKTGSVVVDIAAEQGGNCELTQAGEVITVDGVKIVGLLNLPGMLAFHASKLYSKNVLSLLSLLIKEEKPVFDFEDEIILNTTVTHDGEIISPFVKENLK